MSCAATPVPTPSCSIRFPPARRTGSSISATAKDRLALDASVFTALTPGSLSDEAFAVGAATTEDHRILYDAAKGHLFYDADGSGTDHDAVLLATLLGKPELTASDLLVV